MEANEITVVAFADAIWSEPLSSDYTGRLCELRFVILRSVGVDADLFLNGPK